MIRTRLLSAVLVAALADAPWWRVPPWERMPVVEQVGDMYGHAFESYMRHAFPHDELRPLSCDGRRHKERGDLDAVLGNYSLTLIDALDSLVIFGRPADFFEAVEHICTKVSFDKDVEVSTFEVNIRALGGLLSGHMHAWRLREEEGYEYNGGLLVQALDLSSRLLVAFETPTGMPLSRINLRRGKPKKVASTVTIAEAGSFLLEFGVLSLLTGNETWYNVAKKSVLVFWSKRSGLGLVGSLIDTTSGDLKDLQGTVGPGQDSFYEYLLKGYILFDDTELLDMFLTTYSAVEEHISFEGFTYNVDIYKGLMSNAHLSPLACVWGSLQVLIGDVTGGLRTVLYWFSLWSKHGALPEVFDTKTEAPTSARDSPLRPELVEAMFYLSMALPDDPEVFRMVKSMVQALDSQSRVECGFASVADVTTKRLDDRMDSFFLSETLVYLYLTALSPGERQHLSPWPLSSVVFSTEGHMFPVPLPGLGVYAVSRMPGVHKRSEKLYPELSRRPMGSCKALSPFERVAVHARCRTKYFLTSQFQLEARGHAPGQCRPQEVVVVVRAADGNSSQLLMVAEGIASSFGPQLATLTPQAAEELSAQTASCSSEAECQQLEGTPARWTHTQRLGLPALDLDRDTGELPPFSLARHEILRAIFATRTLVAATPLDGCTPLQVPRTAAGGGSLPDDDAVRNYYGGRVVVIARGSCLFLYKLQRLQHARAAGALVINQETEGQPEELLVMTCPLQDKGAGRDVHIPATMISSSDGAALLDMLRVRDEGTVTAGMFAPH